MQDWKLRQKIYHQIFSSSDIGDSLLKEKIIEIWDEKTIISKAINYIYQDEEVLYYPAKSFIVAIIYAKLLKKHFGVELIESLSDPDLLYGNDPYFEPYEVAKETYNQILANFPDDAIENPERYSKNFSKTCNYFLLEFLLHESTRIYAANN